MKKTIQNALGGAFVIVLFFFVNFHVASCTGTGSTDTNGRKGGGPKFRITTTNPIYAGSEIRLGCESPDCQVAFANGSTDSSGNKGGRPKIIFTCTIPFDIPANTPLVITFGPKGNPAISE